MFHSRRIQFRLICSTGLSECAFCFYAFYGFTLLQQADWKECYGLSTSVDIFWVIMCYWFGVNIFREISLFLILTVGRVQRSRSACRLSHAPAVNQNVLVPDLSEKEKHWLINRLATESHCTGQKRIEIAPTVECKAHPKGLINSALYSLSLPSISSFTQLAAINTSYFAIRRLKVFGVFRLQLPRRPVCMFCFSLLLLGY